ncbi:3-oxoacyl-[acyl-carrier-protein] synthase III C-terminal domain-containing protein, partial [Salmonella enterica]
LDQGLREGRIKAAHLLSVEGFGGGFTWGSALIRF